MWGVAVIFIVVASCNAELSETKSRDLPMNTTGNRIVSGSATTIDKYPFAVQVLYSSKYRCGGSLVTRQHVLSAAHCFVNRNTFRPEKRSIFTIREGTTFVNDSGSVHKVKDIILHRLYNFMINNNDVAVVMMATRVDLTTSVARIVHIIKQGAIVPDNSSVTAVGWGLSKQDTIFVLSPVLNEVTMRTINRETCQNHYKKYMSRRITSSMICAGILDVGGKDTCDGDSGGALLHSGILVGIVSWGVGCARPNYPGVYARVAKFTNWIKYTVKKSLQRNEIGNSNKPGETYSHGSKVRAITLLTPVLLFLLLILSI